MWKKTWNHTGETLPLPMEKTTTQSIQSDKERHWRVIKDCPRLPHISLDPGTREITLHWVQPLFSFYAMESVLTCWAQTRDVGSYPHRPTRPRPPTFLHSTRNGIHWKADMFCQCRPRLALNQWLEGEGKSFHVSFSAVIPSYTYGIYSLQV